ncbi:CapA family protein, partial [Clostridium tarantellae]
NNINKESKEVFKEACINTKDNFLKTISFKKDITISAVGDIIVHDEQLKSAYNKETKKYDFKENFSEIKEYLSKSNFTYASIEGTYSGKEIGEYTGYPIYNSPEDMLKAIKEAGVDLVALNSEHILDKGVEGIYNTIKNCDDNGLEYIGIKDNKKSKNYILKNINGITSV